MAKTGFWPNRHWKILIGRDLRILTLPYPPPFPQLDWLGANGFKPNIDKKDRKCKSPWW